MSDAFAFVQFEFAFLLGPGDGRFLVRRAPEALPERVLILATLGARERRLLKGRRGRRVTHADPEAVPTSRATVVRPEPFPAQELAVRWLEQLHDDAERQDSEVEGAVRILNRALRAHRAARADPAARDVSPSQALVVRLGFGAGEAVADGHYGQAWELPHERHGRVRRSMEAPDERFAALLGGREPLLVCEELVLRARADLSARRAREAALQARVALESLLSELERGVAGDRRNALEADRAAVGAAANAALLGDLGQETIAAVDAAVGRMEAALRVHRLEGAS
ncbi:MAG: hypothetical protein ACR2FZ_05275 [Thermoleophilaceae bacterium]